MPGALIGKKITHPGCGCLSLPLSLWGAPPSGPGLATLPYMLACAKLRRSDSVTVPELYIKLILTRKLTKSKGLSRQVLIMGALIMGRYIYDGVFRKRCRWTFSDSWTFPETICQVLILRDTHSGYYRR